MCGRQQRPNTRRGQAPGRAIYHEGHDDKSGFFLDWSRQPRGGGGRFVAGNGRGFGEDRGVSTDWNRLRHGLERRLNALLPPRWTTLARLQRADPGCWREIRPAVDVSWPRALGSGPLPENFRACLATRFPACGVLTLPDGEVFSEHGWVFTRNGERVPDLSMQGERVQYAPRVHRPRLTRRPERLRGRTVSLVGLHTTCSYFHLACDALPRIELLRQAGHNWGDFDHILFPRYLTPSTERLITAAGVPRDRVRWVGWGEPLYVRCEELVCPSFPSAWRTVAPWVAEYVAGLRDFGPVARPRRLFVTRRAGRRLLRNEAELWSELAARGFEAVDPGAMADAEAAFHEADFVVGAHGAALTNLAFCRPGTKVVELVPSDQPFPYYYTLALARKLDYGCVICPSDFEQPRDPLVSWHSPSDFTADRSAVIALVDRMLAG